MWWIERKTRRGGGVGELRRNEICVNVVEFKRQESTCLKSTKNVKTITGSSDNNTAVFVSLGLFRMTPRTLLDCTV